MPLPDSVLLKGGLVLTMDDRHTSIPGGDVLVVGQQVAAVGTDLAAPEGTVEIDCTGGIVLPGHVDTHRHMWQTAMRGYGADWTLTQYFVWYYLEHGRAFRPEDIYAGNLLSAIEALDAGVTTTVDWSHGLQTAQHADAAVDALESVPGRFVLAYGNIQAGPVGVVGHPGVPRLRRAADAPRDLLGFQMAFDVTGDPAFPEQAAFEVARELDVPVTTHAGVWGATNDDGIRLMYEDGFMTPRTIYVHAASLSADSYQRIAATGGSVSVSTESEQSGGQGYPPTWALRSYDIPVSLSMDTSVWWSGDLFSAMRATLGADRSREHLEAHAAARPSPTTTCAPSRSSTGPPAAARGPSGCDDRIGSIEVGKQADLVLLKNDRSPVMFPILNPYGHVALQAQRADVDTVLVNGRVVKRAGRLVDVDLDRARSAVEATIEHLRSEMGEEAWVAGMNPEIPETKILDNPYTYTEFRTESTHTQ